MRQIRNHCETNEGKTIELRYFGKFAKIDGAYQFEPSNDFLYDTKLRISGSMDAINECVNNFIKQFSI
jgi:hypothetical protein